MLLAFGTVSQLGLLMVLFGIGLPEVTAAAVAMLIAHVLFKAALFLVVGAVDHAAGTRDIRRLSGVGRALPWLAGFAAVASASMVGFPPMFGFVAKEAALAALIHEDGVWAGVALISVALGSVLTVAYTWRLWVGLFGDRTDPAAGPTSVVHHRPDPRLMVPIAVLTVATVAGGLVAGSVGAQVGKVARALDSSSHGHLTLWPGLSAPLALSVGIIVVGLAVVRWRPAGVGVGFGPTGDGTYQWLLDGLMRLSRRTAAVTQNGSLPSYVGVVFAVVVAVLAAAFGAGAAIGDVSVWFADSAVQALIAIVVSAVTLTVAMARRRFVSVILLGVVGYGMALLFFLYGAPDLALTQLLVETLVIVVFMQVVRRLPEMYSPAPSWAPRVWRIAIATAVGAGTAAFALVAGTARTDRPVTDEMADRAVDEAGGRNLVNVIIVDFRGFDTLGEISVLALAAIGVANLVGAARRAEGDETVDAAEVTPLPERSRSVIFDTVARMAFHLIIVLSVYVTFRGHNAPGGGFAGGMIAGAAFLMRFLAGGQPRLRRSYRVPPVALMGVGLAIAGATAVAGMFGGEALESGIATVELPGVGPVKLVSSTVLDLGVYAVVVGAVLSIVANLGADNPAQSEAVTP